jgi:uncharacterized membrane protein
VTVLLLANCAATWFLTGLIWFVQVVHYPLFERVGRDGYGQYQAAHQRLTTRVVAPPMLVELATSAMLAWNPPARLPATWLWVGFALVLVIWLSTAWLQVPQHNLLGSGFHSAAWKRLVFTNWLRTGAWSLRALLMMWLLTRSA